MKCVLIRRHQNFNDSFVIFAPFCPVLRVSRSITHLTSGAQDHVLTVTYCHLLSRTVTVNSTTNKEAHLHSYGYSPVVTQRCSIGMAGSHMRALYNQNSYEALLFQYCNHVIDCSVLQCVQSGLETRDDVSSLVAWLG